jgi:PAS domain S-box-containing protein
MDYSLRDQTVPLLKKQNSNIILLSFIVAIVALLGVSMVFYTTMRHIDDKTDWVEHSYQVLESIQRLRGDIRNADNPLQSYLLTHNPDYKRIYDSEKELTLLDFSETSQLTADNPLQRTYLEILRPLLETQLASMEESSRLVEETRDQAFFRFLQTQNAKHLEQKIESCLSNMEITERLLLQKRSSEVDGDIFRSYLLIFGGSFLVSLFCFVTAFFINKQMRQRNQAVQLLESSEERFRSLAEAATDAFITVDEKGKIVGVNPASEILFGYSPQELVGKPLTATFPKRFMEEHGEKAFEAFVKITDPSQGTRSVELFAKHRDGSEFPVEVSLASWHTREGNFHTVFARDITERKFFTKMLLKNEHRLFQFLEAIPIGIFVTDHIGKPYYANQAAKSLLGKPVDPRASLEKLSEIYQAYLSDSDQLYPTERMPMVRALSGERTIVDDMEIRRPDKTIPVQVWGVPILDETDRVKYGVGVFLDVTEKKQTMSALQEREEFFRTLFEESPIGMTLLFPDWRMLNVNQALCNLLGYTKSELMAMDPKESTHPDDLEIDQSLSKKLFQKIIPKYQIEKRYFTKDKRMIWCKVSASLIRDVNDTPLFRLAMIENVTDQKEAELALKESEKRFRRIFEQSAIGMVFASFENRITDVNQAYCQMLGYTREELLNLSFVDITHPDDASMTNPLLNPTPGGQTKFRFEKRYIGKNKKIIWASLTSLIVQDSKGQPLHIITMAEDITARRETEIALKESQEQMRLILDSAGEGIYGIDPEGHCTFCNPAALEMLGYRHLSDVLGKNMHYLAHSQKPDGSPYPLKDCPIFKSFGEGKGCHVMDEVFVRADGTFFPVEYRSYPMKRSGTVVGAVVSFTDITERKQVDDMKRDLISVVSHQLKTPVAEINGYVENLLEGLAGALLPKQREYLADMREIGMENYRLISDLLSLSKIERGIISVDLQPVQLSQLVDLSIRDYTSMIQRKGLDLILENTPKEITVLADRDKTVETLRNIINNALKCTDKGGITIQTGAQNGFGWIKVGDTGIGMTETVLKRLFKKDRILGAEASRAGAGLGLYIAKSFMELQKGDISVESEVGKGSSFCLKIPRVEKEPAP